MSRIHWYDHEKGFVTWDSPGVLSLSCVSCVSLETDKEPASLAGTMLKIPFERSLKFYEQKIGPDSLNIRGQFCNAICRK